MEKTQQIRAIRYCRCGYPLAVVATYKNDEGRRQYVDRAHPAGRIFRCPNCHAFLSESEGRPAAARQG